MQEPFDNEWPDDYDKYSDAQDAQADAAWDEWVESQNTIDRAGNTPPISRPDIILPKGDDLPF